MPQWLDTLLVISMVALAAGIFFRRWFHRSESRGPGCSLGCCQVQPNTTSHRFGSGK